MERAVNFGHMSKYRSELMGVFCLWIMCFHSELIVTWPKALNPLRLIVIRGNSGVDAFLILSGVSLYFAYTKMTATESRLGRRLGKWVKEKKPLPSSAVVGAGVFMLIYLFIFGAAVSKTTIWMRLSYASFAMSALLVFTWVFWKLDSCTWLHKFFAFFGDRSLELYLTHLMIKKTWRFYFEDKMWDPWGVLPYLCILLIAVAVSAALHPLVQWIAKKLLSVGAAKPTVRG